MELRKFHITDLPSDRIFVKIDELYRIKIFGLIKKKYGFTNFNKIFFDNDLKYSTFKQWQKGKTNFKYRIKQHFIPLWFVIELSKILNIPVIELEKQIIAYKGPSSAAIISNPNFPLIEDERLLKILAHMLGDGHVGGSFGTGLPNGGSNSDYRNFEPILLDQFEKDLQVFGKVPTSKDYKHGHVILPNVIGYLLKHIYKINFGCFNSKIPFLLFKLPSELIAAFMRAFGDDEAHVYDNHIDFYSANKELLIGLMNLIKKKFSSIKISEIKVNRSSKNPKYYFYILSESRKKFAEQIGFDHPQKMEDLVYNIKRFSSKRKFEIGRTKKVILDYLSQESLTAKELSRKIGISHGTTLDHLNRLRDDGKVSVIDKAKTSAIWSI